MSFILDALQKADRERQAQPEPTAGKQSFGACLSHSPALTPPRRPTARWTYLLIALLAVALLLWLTGRGTEAARSSADTRPDTTAASAAVAPFAPPQTVIEQTTPADSPAKATLATAAPPPATARRKVPASAPPTRRIAAPPASAPTPGTSPTAPADTPASPAHAATGHDDTATPQDMPPRLAELPASLRNQLPSLQVTAHSYSKRPGASYVFINDQLLHEGEHLAHGLQLERITADGMIFSHQGQRFWRGLQP